jgi:hypothetical protein
MKVFIVLGDDRGCGATVDGVFSSLDLAKDYEARNSNCYLDSECGEDVQGKIKPQKGIEEVTAYRTKDGDLFANAEMAAIHAEWLDAIYRIDKDELNLMVENQCRCKRAMKNLRGKDAAAMQSEIDKRAVRIDSLMRFIKRGGA